jgi:hypothetical protein
VARLPPPAVAGGETPLRHQAPRRSPRVEHLDPTRPDQRERPSGRACAEPPQRSAVASSGRNPSAQPQNAGLGALLPHLGRPSDLWSLRLSALGPASPLGLPAPPASLAQRAASPVLAPTGGRCPCSVGCTGAACGPGMAHPPSGEPRQVAGAGCRESASLGWGRGVLESPPGTLPDGANPGGHPAQTPARPWSLWRTVRPTC